jgi:hypothetical protein
MAKPPPTRLPGSPDPALDCTRWRTCQAQERADEEGDANETDRKVGEQTEEWINPKAQDQPYAE